jgi:hypothetical protein
MILLEVQRPYQHGTYSWKIYVRETYQIDRLTCAEVGLKGYASVCIVCCVVFSGIVCVRVCVCGRGGWEGGYGGGGVRVWGVGVCGGWAGVCVCVCVCGARERVTRIMGLCFVLIMCAV